MALKICIADDEPLAIDEMKRLLETIDGVYVSAVATSATETVQMVSREKPDLLLLDIQLKSTNAFSIINQLDAAKHIVFVTAYDQYALRAFEINALDYLLKPVHPHRIEEAISRAQANEKPLQPETVQYKYTDRIITSERSEYRLIKIKEIVAIAADGDYSVLYCADGKKCLLLRSLNKWETQLPQAYFQRIHRGTIINMEYIRRIEKGLNNTCIVCMQHCNDPFHMSQRYTTKFLASYKA